MGIRVGYGRTSSLDQVAGFDDQKRALEEAGCTKLFCEQVSAVAAKRPELDRLIEYVREGDTVVVTRLDRLARDTKHLLSLAEAFEKNGVALEVLDIRLDTSTPVGKLMLVMLGGIAEFERSIMRERQKIGVEAARKAGKYRGRKPTARAKADAVIDLHRQGVGAAEIARRTEIGRASVYRILASAKNASGVSAA